MSISPSEGSRLARELAARGGSARQRRDARQAHGGRTALPAHLPARATCWRCGWAGGPPGASRASSAPSPSAATRTRASSTSCARTRRSCAATPTTPSRGGATPPSTPSTAFPCSRRSAATARRRSSCAICGQRLLRRGERVVELVRGVRSQDGARRVARARLGDRLRAAAAGRGVGRARLPGARRHALLPPLRLAF
jgi:hypothetical protein